MMFKIGDELGTGEGQLYVLESNLTRIYTHSTCRHLGIHHGTYYANAFYAANGWEPISGGGFDRLRAAFAVNPLIAVARGVLSDTPGVAAGVQLFPADEDQSLTPEVAYEAPSGSAVWAAGLRYQRKTSTRSFLDFQGFINWSDDRTFRRDGLFLRIHGCCDRDDKMKATRTVGTLAFRQSGSRSIVDPTALPGHRLQRLLQLSPGRAGILDIEPDNEPLGIEHVNPRQHGLADLGKCRPILINQGRKVRLGLGEMLFCRRRIDSDPDAHDRHTRFAKSFLHIRTEIAKQCPRHGTFPIPKNDNGRRFTDQIERVSQVAVDVWKGGDRQGIADPHETTRRMAGRKHHRRHLRWLCTDGHPVASRDQQDEPPAISEASGAYRSYSSQAPLEDTIENGVSDSLLSLLPPVHVICAFGCGIAALGQSSFRY